MLSWKVVTEARRGFVASPSPQQTEPDSNPGLADSWSCVLPAQELAQGQPGEGACVEQCGPLAQPQRKSPWPCEQFYHIPLVPLYGDW